MRRILDWAFYAGLVALAAAVVQPFARTEWHRAWWPLVVVGIVLIVLSILPRAWDSRAAMGRRSVRYGVNATVAVVLVVGVVSFVEALSYAHNTRWDLTENQRYSLSPQTIKLLHELKTDVNAVGFFRTDQPGKRVAEDLFKQYARYGGRKFTWKVVDPDREPALARRYGIDAYGTTVLETKTRSEKVTDADEEKLTNGLVKVTREAKPIVYVIQGHGENDLQSSDRPGLSDAKTALEKSNYQVKPLVLARQAKVPDDATVVILAGPKTDLFPPEVDALDAYVGRGGKLLVMMNPPFPQRVQDDAVKKLLAKYGVTLGDDLVVEVSPIGQLFGIGPEVPIVQQYEPHPITRDMGGLTTLFPLARTVDAAKKPPAGVNVQPLARTSADSWGETSRQEIESGQVRPDPQDPRGPLTIAAVATKDKARIVVYGTSNLATNQFLNLQGNRDFFLNTVSWLAEQEDLISIRPKDTKQTPVFLTSQQAQAVFWLPVVILPGLAIVGGVVALARRRAAR